MDMNIYPYLADPEFLAEVDAYPNKEVYVRLNVIDYKGQAVGAIEGLATGGSLNINGSSAIRVSGNVSLVATKEMQQITSLDNLIAMNKKVQVEIGYLNVFSKYTDYTYIWFPLGELLIAQPQITHNETQINMSLQLKDQMCLLNGDLGGKLPAAVEFSPDTDGYATPIKELIILILTEFGNIPRNKIIIRGIEDRLQNMCRWADNQNVYLIKENNIPKKLTLVAPATIDENCQTFTYGSMIGYSNVDFVYPGKLSANPGETITSVLDKIKNALGNYEYFFDVEGNFIFQPIRNFLNVGSEKENLTEALTDKYLDSGGDNAKALFEFKDLSLIKTISHTASYTQAKNDFNVWGKKDNNAIRYHLVIDEMPILATKTFTFYAKELPSGYWIAYKNENEARAAFAKNHLVWDETSGRNQQINSQYLDWRTYLYLDGVCNNSTNYYVKELIPNWYRVVNVHKLTNEQAQSVNWDYFLDNPNNYPYFLDIIDSTLSQINQFNIAKIGRKVENLSDDKVNCLFSYLPTNDVIYIEAGTEATARTREECKNGDKHCIQVQSSVYSGISDKITANSAFEKVRSVLHEYLGFKNSINITCLPLYHLQPNTRIRLTDPAADVSGDYMVNTLTVPLTANGTMSITATKALERI